MNLDCLPTYCHVEKWSVVNGEPQHPSQVLGYSTWKAFLDYMATNRATRNGDDQFDCVEPDGTVTRYVAADAHPDQIGEQP